MANLFFRRGEYNGLFKGHNGQPLPLAEGTIYFTTDEGGMYIDTADKRVRIQGSVLYFDTLEHFVQEVKPPFSQDVLYFIAKSESEGKATKYNALLRWDGSKWIQLNVTAESFTALESLVNGHTLSITNLQERLNAIDGGTTSQGSLAELANKITAVEETLNGKEGTTGLVDKVTNAEKAIEEHGKTIEDYGKDISNQGKAITEIKEDLLPKYVEKEELDPVIEALSGDVSTLKDDRDDAKERLDAIDGADGRLAGIDASIQNLVNADTAFDTRVGNAEGRIGDLENASRDYSNRIIALETTVNGTDSVTGLVSRVGTLEGTVSTQGQTITNQGAAITDI
jgi:chromosome segregation ATPase